MMQQRSAPSVPQQQQRQPPSQLGVNMPEGPRASEPARAQSTPPDPPMRAVSPPDLLLLLLLAALALELTPASACTIRPGTVPLDTDGRPVEARGAGMYNEGGLNYLVGTSLKQAVPVDKLQPKSAKVYLSRTLNIYRSATLCNWTLISGSGAFNRSTLEANMPGVSAGETVRMERPKLAKATDGSGYVIWMHAQDGGHGTNSDVAVVHSKTIAGPYTWVR